MFKLLPKRHIFFDLVIRFITNRKYAFFCIFQVRLSADNIILIYWIKIDHEQYETLYMITTEICGTVHIDLKLSSHLPRAKLHDAQNPQSFAVQFKLAISLLFYQISVTLSVTLYIVRLFALCLSILQKMASGERTSTPKPGAAVRRGGKRLRSAICSDSSVDGELSYLDLDTGRVLSASRTDNISMSTNLYDTIMSKLLSF